MWDAPQGKGIDKTASPLFSVAPSPSLPVLQAGGGLLVSLIADSPSTMLATLWPLWNGRFHGKPYYNVIGACHPIQSVALDICGIGGGSQAVFAPGTSFSLELTLQGIKDATYAGYGFGDGIPDAVADLCGSPYHALNSDEGGNLSQTVVSSSPDDGFY